MLSVAEALERVLSGVPVLGTESVTLGEARARVLAEPVVAAREIPPWDNSSMDGYAVRARDTDAASADRPVVLEVVGEVTAGRVAVRALGPSEAYRILTGAPLPPGSDAVVPQEDVRRDGAQVTIRKPVDLGAYVRPRGEDIRPGDRILEPGTVLRPAALGVLAALGQARVTVHRRPTVAILSTGDELVDPQAPLGPGQIPDSNTYTISGLAAEAGAVPMSLGIARDRREELVERLRAGAPGGRPGLVGGRVRRRPRFRPRGRGGAGGPPRLLAGEHAAGEAAHVRPDREVPLLRAAREPRVLDGDVRAVRAPSAAAPRRAPGAQPAARPGARARAHRQPRQPTWLSPGPSRARGGAAGRAANRSAGIRDPPIDAPGRWPRRGARATRRSPRGARST